MCSARINYFAIIIYHRPISVSEAYPEIVHLSCEHVCTRFLSTRGCVCVWGGRGGGGGAVFQLSAFSRTLCTLYYAPVYNTLCMHLVYILLIDSFDNVACKEHH